MKISIVITSYNYGRYIGRAIRSCLEQSYNKTKPEILIVDDASTDYTKEVLNSFGGWIRTIFLEKNVGLSKVRNIGIKNAIGTYVVCLDADDYFHEDFLKVCELYFFYYQNKYQAVKTDYFLVDDREENINWVNSIERPIACGVLYKKDSLVDIGLYDEKLGIGEDVDLMMRFQKKYNIFHVPLPLYRYRMHESNMTKDGEYNRKGLEIVKRKHGLEEVKSPYIREKL